MLWSSLNELLYFKTKRLIDGVLLSGAGFGSLDCERVGTNQEPALRRYYEMQQAGLCEADCGRLIDSQRHHAFGALGAPAERPFATPADDSEAFSFNRDFGSLLHGSGFLLFPAD